VPEIGQPARLVILDPTVFREPLLVEGVQGMAYRIQVDPGLGSELFIAPLSLLGEFLEERHPLFTDQAQKVCLYRRLFQDLIHKAFHPYIVVLF